MFRRNASNIQAATTYSTDRLFAALVITLLLPLWLVNIQLAVLRRQKIIVRHWQQDALGRAQLVSEFSAGSFRNSLRLLKVFTGKMRFLGLSTQFHLCVANSIEQAKLTAEFGRVPAGLFSLYDLYFWVGMIDSDHKNTLRLQLHNCQTRSGYYRSLLQIICGYWLYGRSRLEQPAEITLFGIRLHNHSLEEALAWILNTTGRSTCELGFFVNVNSINIAQKNAQFKNNLQTANKLFADGSGIRLAAAHLGKRLRANLNGTDLLPHICQGLISHQQSIFLLGAEAGIAELAARQLQQQITGLQIAGCHHGYFDKNQSEPIISMINASQADVLLVALGSPLQEQWLLTNQHKLQCHTALAVGGLFDFYSEKIPRAPQWLRALGMEWVWRLWQEPIKKFKRYVIGNPVFLIKTYLLNRAGV